MKYKTIVIDPPWHIAAIPQKQITKKTKGWRFTKTHVQKYLDDNKNLDLPYKSMTDKELLEWKLPIELDDNAVMFMWVVNSKIQLGIKLLENYGFTLKRLMAWQKQVGRTNKNTPLNWIRFHGFESNAEFILFGKRGKNILDYKKPIQVNFEARVTGHSKKPTEFYNMIRRSTPDPRIDIFARKRHEGFDSYGNEVE